MKLLGWRTGFPSSSAPTRQNLQNPELNHFLQQTGSRVLVEASLVDRIWGIGMARDNEQANNPNLWRGLNLLGFALMQVRDAGAGETG